MQYSSNKITPMQGQLTVDHAMYFLKQVKTTFIHQTEKYDMFTHILMDFKSQRICTVEVQKRITELFRGYPNLILGFNKFLPKDCEITLTNEEKYDIYSRKPVSFEDAIRFVNKVKEVEGYSEDKPIYRSFLAVLNEYKAHQMGLPEAYQEVASLLKDHPDLLEEFSTFMPEKSITSSQEYENLCALLSKL